MNHGDMTLAKMMGIQNEVAQMNDAQQRAYLGMLNQQNNQMNAYLGMMQQAGYYPEAFPAAIQPALSCPELKDFFKRRLAEKIAKERRRKR